MTFTWAKMSSICFSFILLLISSSFCLADTTIINGRILEYQPDSNSNMAFVGIIDFLRKQRQIRREVQNDGVFELSFDMKHTQDVVFLAGGIQVALLLEPGDTLALVWQFEDGKREDAPLHIRFSGKGAKRNHHFVRMMYKHWNEIDWDSENLRMGKKYRECGPEEFLEYRLRKKEEQENVMMGYLRENGIHDDLLKKWIDYYLTYDPVNDLLGYHIIHAQLNNKRPNEINIPASYYGFLLDLSINDSDALICSEYILFLRRDYYMHKRMQPQLWPDFKEHMERKGIVKTKFNHMLQTTTGLAREVMLTKYLLEMMAQKASISEQVPPLMETYYEVVKEKRFVQAVMKHYRLRYDDKNEIKPTEYLNLLDFKEEEARLLPNLVRQFTNKVIYIDIWATWCGPCIKEMKYYTDLIENYQGKDIEFIFLAAHSPKNLWKNRIIEYNLGGHHYLLNDKQYYSLEEFFELEGLPQHVIINKNGDVVESKGPPIYTPDGHLNKNVLILLDQLLDE